MSAGKPRRILPLVVALLAVALGGGALAAAQYRAYAAVHLRLPRRLPSCVLKARTALRKPALVSGTEPRDTDTGETVYLTPAEDRAVACAILIDKKLAGQLARALSQHDPAPRAQTFLSIFRDEIPPGPDFDRQATAFYRIASGALHVLPPDDEEALAASNELDQLYACRFDTRRHCPTRPPMPAVVWLTSTPATAALLGLLWLGGSAGAAAIGSWWARRKQRRSPTGSGSATGSDSETGSETDSETAAKSGAEITAGSITESETDTAATAGSGGETAPDSTDKPAEPR
ncbi:MAG: hypothetical protein IT372_03165 [Polyangiaceae bacterium]|nr:hypothetical protein [Polyangiaceae bacterium]